MAFTAWSGSIVREPTVAGDDIVLGVGDGVTGGLFSNISALEKTIRLVFL
jgi:hypothetical protein